MKKEQICKNCIYFNSNNDDNGDGECHRYPPTVTNGEDRDGICSWFTFPEVDSYDWCGEYKEEGKP